MQMRRTMRHTKTVNGDICHVLMKFSWNQKRLKHLSLWNETLRTCRIMQVDTPSDVIIEILKAQSWHEMTLVGLPWFTSVTPPPIWKTFKGAMWG